MMMKISKSKRQLAQLLIEAGVTQFPEGANWAAQDRDKSALDSSPLNVMFYSTKPARPIRKGDGYWFATVSLSELVGKPVQLSTLIPNWHQTVLGRDEFDKIVAETVPDADGWIEWGGGECPVSEPSIIDVKLSDGDTLFNVDSDWDWSHDIEGCKVIAYRLHKPEQVETVEYNYPGVAYTGPVQSEFVVTEKPTIEQLATDYRNAKDYAERKQQEADDAKVDADARLKSLEIAGEAIGLLLSPINAKKEPELVIAVQVGDEVECAESNIKRDKYNGMVGRLRTIDESDTSTPYLVDFGGGAKIWCHEVKFIRRP